MLEKLKPRGIKVVGRMAMVRNSIGKGLLVIEQDKTTF